MTGVSYSANPIPTFTEAEAANPLLFMETFMDEAPAAMEASALAAETLTRKREAAMLHAALTQATRANDSLREGMTALIETSAQPTLVLDREGTVTIWNRAIRHLTGITGGTAYGKTIEEIFSGDNLLPLIQGVNDILHAGALPGGLASSAPYRLTQPIRLLAESSPVSITLLPVCLVSGCLDTLIVLIEL